MWLLPADTNGHVRALRSCPVAGELYAHVWSSACTHALASCAHTPFVLTRTGFAEMCCLLCAAPRAAHAISSSLLSGLCGHFRKPLELRPDGFEQICSALLHSCGRSPSHRLLRAFDSPALMSAVLAAGSPQEVPRMLDFTRSVHPLLGLLKTVAFQAARVTSLTARDHLSFHGFASRSAR